MQNLKISTAQFENRSGDKEYNLSVIDQLSEKAASEGAKLLYFTNVPSPDTVLQENSRKNNCRKLQN